MSLFVSPFVPAIFQGVFSAGAKLYFYLTGTTTPAAIYDAAGNPLANPVTADAYGQFAQVYLDPSITYRVDLKNPLGVTIGSSDPYSPTSGSAISFANYSGWAPFKAALDAQTIIAGGAVRASPQGVYPATATFAPSANFTLPANLRMEGRITGTGQGTWDGYNLGVLQNVRIQGGLVVNNCINSQVYGIEDTYVTINGNVGVFGLTMFGVTTPQMTINSTGGYVNQNDFFAGRGPVNIMAGGQSHNNRWWAWDLNNGPFVNSGDGRAYIFGLYSDVGGSIVGDVDIRLAYNLDFTEPPALRRGNYLEGTTGISQRTGKDFIPGAGGWYNLAKGGEFDNCTSAGIPLCLTSQGGSIVNDAENLDPALLGQRITSSVNAAFQGFVVSLDRVSDQTNLNFALYMWVEKLSGPFSGGPLNTVVVDRGDGSPTTGGMSQALIYTTSGGNEWWLIRVCGKGSITQPTALTFYVNGATAATRSVGISGIRASQERYTLLPARQPVNRFGPVIDNHGQRTIRGRAAYSAIPASPGYVDITVTLPKPILAVTANTSVIASPIVSDARTVWIGSTTTGGNFTAVTVRVYGATGTTGEFAYNIVGDAA